MGSRLAERILFFSLLCLGDDLGSLTSSQYRCKPRPSQAFQILDHPTTMARRLGLRCA